MFRQIFLSGEKIKEHEPDSLDSQQSSNADVRNSAILQDRSLDKGMENPKVPLS